MLEAELDSNIRPLCAQFLSLSGKPGLSLTEQLLHYLYCTAQSWNPISNTFTLFSQECTLLGCSHQSTWWTSKDSVHQLWLFLQESGAAPWHSWGSSLSGARAQGALLYPRACCFIPEFQEESRCSGSHWCWWENVRDIWREYWGSERAGNLIQVVGVSGRPRGQAHSELKDRAHCPHLKWKLLLCCQGGFLFCSLLYPYVLAGSRHSVKIC